MSTPSAPVRVQALPPGSHLIHVGPPKTGSTSIQQAAHQSRDLLARHGVHYGGRGVRPRRAGWALGLEGRPSGSEIPPMRFWEDLVADVAAAAPGDRVLVSNEDFGRADLPTARRIVADLGGSDPHVVFVARRLDKFLPSQWQERVKAGRVFSYEEWLRIVLADPELPYGWDRQAPGYHWERSDAFFAHSTDRIRMWTEVVGPENVTVVVSDPADRQRVPHAFEALLGLPEGSLPEPARDNESLHWGAVEFVREMNRLAEQLPLQKLERRALFDKGVVNALAHHPHDQPGPRVPPLPSWAVPAVEGMARRRVEELRDLGVRLVGDPDGLLVPPDVPQAETLVPPLLAPTTAAFGVDWFVQHLLSTTRSDQAPQASPAQPGSSVAQDAVALTRRVVAGVRRRVAGFTRG